MGVNLGRSPTVKNKIAAFETKCYRKILRISWIKKVTNAAIMRELNVKENWLNNMVLSRKLQYFGHIKRHDSLEKTIMEGMVPGKRSTMQTKKKMDARHQIPPEHDGNRDRKIGPRQTEVSKGCDCY